MRDFRSTALVGTPTDALRIAEALEEQGIPRTSLHLRWGMFGSAPWSENLRARIESQLGISATDNYSISEVMGPGVSGECEEKDGLHINEDHFLCEVIDPESAEVLPPGEPGELAITTLTKEALPMLRYRTRDLTSIDTRPCPCGRTLARMARVSSRTDDMLIIGGVKVFPAQIEHVLTGVEGVEPHYRVIVEEAGGVDRVEVQVEVSGALLTGDVGRLLKTQNLLRQRLQADLGLSAELKLVEPRTIGPVDQPSQRIVDRRRAEGGKRSKAE
jgi:phenylacetate-CoA ligase